MTPRTTRLALALSGGGTRAMAYHCGVLRWLASKGWFERVEHISSVSGGSLLTGLIFRYSDWRWPSSEQFTQTVLPAIRTMLTSRSLQKRAALRFLWPPNWRFALARASVIRDTIRSFWEVTHDMADLPDRPVWSCNATTGETGRRFRFKSDTCGDYELGYTQATLFGIADAMAASAAFPVLVGPLILKADGYRWHKRSTWGSSAADAEEVPPPFKRLHLYDGGIYDNLGVEPFFDQGKAAFKPDAGVDALIVSDGGSSLERRRLQAFFNPFRAKRLIDIALDQVRALRVRVLVPFFAANPGRGFYAMLGADAKTQIERLRGFFPDCVGELVERPWMTSDTVSRAAAYRTTLARMRPEDFDLLAKHGEETATWNERLFLPEG